MQKILKTHLEKAAVHPAWPAGKGRSWVVQRGNHFGLRDGIPKVLVKDPAGRKVGWPGAEDAGLNGDVHFVSGP